MRPNQPSDFMRYVLVVPNGCWNWVGHTNRGGYGQMRVRGKTYSAHRLSFMLNRGPIPDGVCVLHRCDVPACVNPDHLFLGTDLDNKNDMIAKGRNPIGPKHGRARLTPEQVAEIRTKRSAGSGLRSLAKEFGVSQTAIFNVVKKHWSDK